MSNKHPSGTKRRRLAVGPPGYGAPTDPVTAVLFNPSLLAKIWPVGEKEVDAAHSGPELCTDLRKRIGTFRMVCKDARATFDAACGASLVFGPQRRCFVLTLEPARASPSQALDRALGMLRRGWRPREIRIWVDEKRYPGEWREGARDLLQAISRISGRPGEGVVSFQLPAWRLSPAAASRIARVFPNLSRLKLTELGRSSTKRLQSSAGNLARLLGVAPAAEGGEARAAAGGEETGGGVGHGLVPLLPHLTDLELTGSRRLPSSFASLLRQATQLRSLHLRDLELSDRDRQGQEAASPGPLEAVASLTQLKALSLCSCEVPLLPVLTGALTSLTSLELSGQRASPSLSPALFLRLQSLQRLEVPCASLEVVGLAEALSSLTRLNVNVFTLPAQELNQPLTSIPHWRLPAGLRELGLETEVDNLCQHPEVWAGLELPAGVRLIPDFDVSNFSLIPGRHTGPPVEEGGVAGTELLPAAEKALCGALNFMHRHKLCEGGTVIISFDEEGALQPVGGPAGTGPGRPNHGRWLREVAALRPSSLELTGIRLSHQDLDVIKDMVELEAVTFESPTEVPVMSLPLLAGLPRLWHLSLDAGPWAGPDPASCELRGQALASIVALGRARAPTPSLHLTLSSQPVDEGPLRQLSMRAQEELGLWGVNSVSIRT